MPRSLVTALIATVWASGGVALSAPEAGEVGGAPMLDLDVERHVEEALARHDQAEVPRFGVQVVEHWPQNHLDAHLRGADLECQPSRAGPPTMMEMRRFTGSGSIPVHADFLGPLRALARLFSSPKSPRYFLYRIHHEDGAVHVLKEGRVSEAALATPGATWELIAAYSELKRGTAALRRLERGAPGPERESDDERLPPWVETTCRPPGLD